MMKNVRKIIMVAGAVAMAVLIGIGSVSGHAEAKKKKGWRLTTKKPVSLTAKESKKYVKAGKIKFKYNTWKNEFELTSFKKNKYAPVSKKYFAKKYVVSIISIDGKGYNFAQHESSSSLFSNAKGFDGSVYFEKILGKPGKHKIKMNVSFGGKNGNYEKDFIWTGTFKIEEACDFYEHGKSKIVVSHTERVRRGKGDFHILALAINNPTAFCVNHLVTNVDAKLDIKVKYVFDKRHINEDALSSLADMKHTTTDKILKLFGNISDVVTFNKSFHVKAWDANRAKYNPYSLDIIDFPQYYSFNQKIFTEKINDIYEEIWNLFKPEVTYTITSKKTGKVLRNVTTTKVLSKSE